MSPVVAHVPSVDAWAHVHLGSCPVIHRSWLSLSRHRSWLAPSRSRSRSLRSVYVSMLDFHDPARAKALRRSVLLLAHRFPVVRKSTAEALYIKLLANEEVVDQVMLESSAVTL